MGRKTPLGVEAERYVDAPRFQFWISPCGFKRSRHRADGGEDETTSSQIADVTFVGCPLLIKIGFDLLWCVADEIGACDLALPSVVGCVCGPRGVCVGNGGDAIKQSHPNCD